MSSLALTVTPHVPTSDRLMVEFDRALTAFNVHTPLQFVHWDQRAAPPTKYDYVIKAVDGRVFSQVYDFADSAVPPAEVPSAKTAGDGWSIVEINLHRSIRAVLLLIVQQYNVTSLRATLT